VFLARIVGYFYRPTQALPPFALALAPAHTKPRTRTVYSQPMKARREPGLRAASADSPCVQVCTLHPDGSYCLGCFRTTTEIGDWSTYSAAERDTVLRELDVRRARRREERRKNRPSLRSSRQDHST